MEQGLCRRVKLDKAVEIDGDQTAGFAISLLKLARGRCPDFTRTDAHPRMRVVTWSWLAAA